MSRKSPNSLDWFLLSVSDDPFGKVKYRTIKIPTSKLSLWPFSCYPNSKALLAQTFASIWTHVRALSVEPPFSQGESRLDNLSSLNFCISNQCNLYLQHCWWAKGTLRIFPVYARVVTFTVRMKYRHALSPTENWPFSQRYLLVS